MLFGGDNLAAAAGGAVAGVLALAAVAVAAGLGFVPFPVNALRRSSRCCCAFHLASSIARSAADFLPSCGANTFCERCSSDLGSTYFRTSAAARAAAAEIFSSLKPMLLGAWRIWLRAGGIRTLPG